MSDLRGRVIAAPTASVVNFEDYLILKKGGLRAVYDKMVWPGFNPDGAVTWRGLLDYERWLLNEHRITEFVAPARFLDRSFVENAVKTLGPIRP